MSGVVLASDTIPCFLACTPEGPGTPFGSPLLIVFDTLRILCMIAAIVVIVLTPRIILGIERWGQALRFAGLAGFCLVSIDSRLEHLGDYPSVRLLVDIAATMATVVGVWSYLYREDGHRQRNPERRDL